MSVEEEEEETSKGEAKRKEKNKPRLAGAHETVKASALLEAGEGRIFTDSASIGSGV